MMSSFPGVTDAQLRLARRISQAGLGVSYSQAIKAFQRRQDERIEEWKRMMAEKEEDMVVRSVSLQVGFQIAIQETTIYDTGDTPLKVGGVVTEIEYGSPSRITIRLDTHATLVLFV
jgi:hypothetical protein